MVFVSFFFPPLPSFLEGLQLFCFLVMNLTFTQSLKAGIAPLSRDSISRSEISDRRQGEITAYRETTSSKWLPHYLQHNHMLNISCQQRRQATWSAIVFISLFCSGLDQENKKKKTHLLFYCLEFCEKCVNRGAYIDFVS